MPVDQTPFYLIATSLAFVLAMLMTRFWQRRPGDNGFGYWVCASWVLVVSDAVFIFRNRIPTGIGEVLPTVVLTIAYGFAFFGSQRLAGMRPSRRWLLIAVVVQSLGLFFVLRHTNLPNARMIFNRIFWGGFCVGSIVALRKTTRYRWHSVDSPAMIFVLQAIWLALQMVGAAVVAATHNAWLTWALKYLDYVDVILFDTALFVSVLLTKLELQIEEAAKAQTEVETLSGLLPVCAWCKQVRDDDGYWREVTAYLAQTNKAKITHAICFNCATKLQTDR